MDFAKKILNKYGWKEGNGLGKNSDGIAKPLKVNLKFDKSGLGADQAVSDFNNHWWERVFNDAASNVDVKLQQDGGGVCINLKDQNEMVEITTKRYSVQKLKKTKKNKNDKMYGDFLQSSTLTNTAVMVENPDRITAKDIEVQQYKQLTDEELFKACGGRTAHKGARHGLKLSGKLARLEMQEKELLDKMFGKFKEHEEEKLSVKVDKEEQKMKIKKKKIACAAEALVVIVKDKIKKTKKDGLNIDEINGGFTKETLAEPKIRNNKRKKGTNSDEVQTLAVEEQKAQRKSSRKDCNLEFENISVELMPQKKKKKRKLQSNDVPEHLSQEQANDIKTKKSKKKK